MSRGDTITATPALARVVRDLRVMPPYERAYAVGRLLTELRAGADALVDMRRAAVREMRDGLGLSFEEIAELTELYPPRVRAIYEGRDRELGRGSSGGSSGRTRSTP